MNHACFHLATDFFNSLLERFPIGWNRAHPGAASKWKKTCRYSCEARQFENTTLRVVVKRVAQDGSYFD